MKRNPVVLIVDDQEDNRFTLQIVLKNERYDFIEALDGKEAITKAIEHKPDIILMDAVMPIMNGFEATQEIRKIPSLERVPILMVTALNDKEDRIKALEAGVNDFVSKPFDKHEVIARCRSYVNMSQLNEKYINATENAITRLPNRAALLDDLTKITHPIIIVFAIDDHENLNDFYSDEIMKKLEIKTVELVQKLFPMESSRYRLYNIRFGEFAIILDNSSLLLSNKEQLLDLCNQFYNKIRAEAIHFDDYEFALSITIGISIDDHNPLDSAKTALKEAQRQKKHLLCSEGVIEKAYSYVSNNIKWIKKIRLAIQQDKIIPYFQPIYHNQTSKIEKYESLIRLVNEDNEVISPFFFLEIAKKAKYYHQLTRIMFDKSIEFFRDKDIEFSVNLSGSDIENHELREYIIKTLDKNPEVASRLVLELLEDESFENYDTFKNFIGHVKKLGVQIAIDDFGSGYSNFTRLMDYQPDILKIDGSLIKNIDTDGFSLHIVKTIKAFADYMGIKLVAEFVHSQEVFTIIKNLGIDYSQGYFIAEPLTREDPSFSML